MTLHTRARLRTKQHIIVNEIIENPCKLIISGLGSGKTAATLTACRDLLDSFTVRHVLVIAPLRVATDVWPVEIEAWQHTRLMTYAVACGEPAQREAAVAARAEITIINRENLVWLAKHIQSVKNWFWDMVVVDESSMFKDGSKKTKKSRVKKRENGWTIVHRDDPLLPVGDDLFFDTEAEAREYIELEGMVLGLLDDPQALITKPTTRTQIKVRKGGNMTRFGVLTTARQKIDRVVELTATPRPNSYEDLWGQMYLLDQGQALGRSKKAFYDRWFDKNPYTYQYAAKPGAGEQIMDACRHLMVSLPPDKLVPDPVYIPVKVRLPEKVMREYRDFQKTLVSEPYDVEAATGGVLANKLLQFSNGAMYREDGSVVAVHDEKLKALDGIVEESAGENLLVFYSFKFDLDALRKRYPEAVVLSESQTAVEDWNAGRIKMLLAHPASCAHGLNMQFGGHIAVWFGFTWSLELWLQANGRLPRPGQKEVVAVYMLIAEGTYDERAVEVLSARNADQNKMIESVEHYLFNRV